MATQTDINKIQLNVMTKEQYDSATISDNEFYMITDIGTVECTQGSATGSATQPVYVDSDGVATACTYELNKTVPADAVFTDTTYTNGTGLSLNGTTFSVDTSVIQPVNTAVTHTASTAVGSTTQPVYIASDGTATPTSYSLAKSVPADALFTDTTYSNFTGASAQSAGTAGLVIAPSAGDQDKYLKGNGSWSVITISSGDIVAALQNITGYSATATQVLKNVAGTIQWVSEPAGAEDFFVTEPSS